MENIIIYADGGCRNNGQDNNIGGWGAVLKFGNHIKKIKGAEKNTTNNRMELMAIIEALLKLKRIDIPIEVYLDSAYIVNCINQKWYIKWRKNGWKTSKKEPVKNQELWEQLLKLIEKFDNITFYKVKGHSGVELNELADKLANKAMDELEGGLK